MDVDHVSDREAQSVTSQGAADEGGGVLKIKGETLWRIFCKCCMQHLNADRQVEYCGLYLIRIQRGGLIWASDREVNVLEKYWKLLS